jgi:hypothetical protein
MPGSDQLSLAERARCKLHLGYPSVAAFNSIQLGMIAVSQPLFLVEKSMDNLLDEAIPLFREHIARLDGINAQLDEARGRFRARSVDEIELQPDEAFMLRREYKTWACSLADLLGCPINAYSEKFNSGGMSPINVPVIHS